MTEADSYQQSNHGVLPQSRVRAINTDAVFGFRDREGNVLSQEEINRRSLDARRKKTEEDKKRFLIHLEECMGVIVLACKKSNINRRTYYNWHKDDANFREAVEAIDEGVLDFAEAKLLQNIKDGEKSSIIFFLKTKGKKRGYVERTELTGAGGGPITMGGTINVADLQAEISPDNLKKMMRGIVEDMEREQKEKDGTAEPRFRVPPSPIAGKPADGGGGGAPPPRVFGKSRV